MGFWKKRKTGRFAFGGQNLVSRAEFRSKMQASALKDCLVQFCTSYGTSRLQDVVG